MKWLGFPKDPDPVLVSWRQVVPTIVTLLAMLSGFLSILVTFEGIRGSNPHLFRLSAQLIMLAMILDGLDGNMARMLKGSSEFGAELDTYVDLTAFGIAPAILIFAVTLQSKDEVIRVLLPSAVAVSGVCRLARFKVKDPLRGQAGYAGLPITANAAWVALFVFISQTPPYDRFSLDQGKVATLFLIGILVFTVLQVTNLRYPKPSKKAAIFVPTAILVGLLFCKVRVLSVRVAIVLLVLAVVYIVIGPLFVKGMTAHKARMDAKKNGSLNNNGSNPIIDNGDGD
ncbi:MAG: CDP-alcohol phosphatidyltransferase family protein [Kiritimatiellae bacterium]|nr:CDP-alcohol phosphatidyltransferase family protein [Kiritimatiellia bacterium]MDD5520046.1 CDP-alcohol phosphatidyltransferase family protein [Kiritimatiellia bacterium]